MAECFSGVGKFTVDYLRWLYLENPDGPASGFDAYEGGRLAAHYACVPATAAIEGREVRVLLSLNTATHPRHQGKGLFTRLAAATYQRAAAEGIAAVYGVANANSTPGFVRKLGFQLVRPLEAEVGFGPLGIDAAAVNQAAFRRIWSPEAAPWRARSPANTVMASVSGGVLRCHAHAMGPVSAYCEYPLHGAPPFPHGKTAPSPFRLHLGLQPRGAWRRNKYFAIPARLRPSPLNLIYLPLASPVRALPADNVSFTFLDFDAY